MIVTYRFRLYPTEKQIQILNGTLETCRHLYNDSLGERSCYWDVGFFEQKQLLTLRKRDDKHLKQVHSQVLQDVILRLDKAYQAFFKKIMKYPKFKRREKYNSFSYPQYGGFKLNDGVIVLSCIGAVQIEMHRVPVGTLKRCTVLRDVDQWYCCITADNGMEKPKQKPIENAVGVDVGLLNWMTLSNGDRIDNTLNFKAETQRIKKLQKRLSRKEKGSHNRQKARTSLAKTWRRVGRSRDDFEHKASKKLADKYDTIVFEKLNINNMVKNHNLAAAIMDATWGKLRQMTAYKVERRGGQVIIVNPSGTSQKCSGCGVVVPKDLSVRKHECPSCKLVLDRDHNAAMNILKLGLEQAHVEKQPLLVKQISKFASVKQEARVLRRG